MLLGHHHLPFYLIMRGRAFHSKLVWLLLVQLQALRGHLLVLLCHHLLPLCHLALSVAMMKGNCNSTHHKNHRQRSVHANQDAIAYTKSIVVGR